MLKTDKNNSIEDLLEELGININIDNKMLKKRTNGLMLSDEQVDVLTRHNINYKEYNNLSSLIFKIEEYIEEVQGYMDIEDIDEVSKELSEQNYYNNTNK